MHWFYIRNLSCGVCVSAVTDAILKLDPEAHIEAKPRVHQLGVRSKADEGSLLRALAERGYPAMPLVGALG